MGPLITGDYDLEAIARRFGTPLFVFSGDAIRERVDEFRDAFGAEWPRFELMPSLKACPILGIRALLSDLIVVVMCLVPVSSRVRFAQVTPPSRCFAQWIDQRRSDRTKNHYLGRSYRHR